jgi:hypothetical protein
VRFIARDSGIREMKDAMSREIIAQFRDAGIGIASGTYDIVGLPPVHVVVDRADSEKLQTSRQRQDDNGRG